MRRFIPLALLLSSCATYSYESGDESLGYRWDYTGSAVMILLFVVLPLWALTYFFRLPRGYKLTISPGAGGGYGSDRYKANLFGPTGDKLPEGWGSYEGDFVLWMRIEACRAARTHKKWGKL